MAHGMDETRNSDLTADRLAKRLGFTWARMEADADWLGLGPKPASRAASGRSARRHVRLRAASR